MRVGGKLQWWGDFCLPLIFKYSDKSCQDSFMVNDNKLCSSQKSILAMLNAEIISVKYAIQLEKQIKQEDTLTLPLSGCNSHRINIALQKLWAQEGSIFYAVVVKVHKLCVALRTLKNTYKLSAKTTATLLRAILIKRRAGALCTRCSIYTSK